MTIVVKACICSLYNTYNTKMNTGYNHVFVYRKRCSEEIKRHGKQDELI